MKKMKSSGKKIKAMPDKSVKYIGGRKKAAKKGKK